MRAALAMPHINTSLHMSIIRRKQALKPTDRLERIDKGLALALPSPEKFKALIMI